MKLKTIDTDRPHDPQSNSELFSLPPEIRNHIYYLVLKASEDDKPVWIRKISSRTPTVLSLLRTCRLVYAEACGIFYSINRLELTPAPTDTWPVRHNLPGTGRAPANLGYFLNSISPGRRQAIRSLHITVRSVQEAARIMMLVRKCTGLQEMHLTIGDLHLGPQFLVQMRKQLQRQEQWIKAVARSLSDDLTIFRVAFLSGYDDKELEESGLIPNLVQDYRRLGEEVAETLLTPLQKARTARQAAKI